MKEADEEKDVAEESEVDYLIRFVFLKRQCLLRPSYKQERKIKNLHGIMQKAEKIIPKTATVKEARGGGGDAEELIKERFCKK